AAAGGNRRGHHQRGQRLRGITEQRAGQQQAQRRGRDHGPTYASTMSVRALQSSGATVAPPGSALASACASASKPLAAYTALAVRFAFIGAAPTTTKPERPSVSATWPAS